MSVQLIHRSASAARPQSTVTDACRIVFPHARRLAEDLPADFKTPEAYEAAEHFFCKQGGACGRCKLLWPRKHGGR